MDVWEFNKGEWTEAYVFLKVLGDGRVYGADTTLHKDPMTYMDIVNIIRDEPDRYLLFERMIKEETCKVKAYDNEVCFKVITPDELREAASSLYHNIMTISNRRAFPIPSAESYLRGLHFAGPKARLSASASKTYGNKTDIIITSNHSRDHAITTAGYSIKSHLGKSATLFNSSTTSGFVYRINGCDDEGMNSINANASSFAATLSAIKENYSLEYAGCRNDVFYDNLSLVDSRMDEIMQNAVLITLGYYGNCKSRRLTDICDELSRVNPLRHRHPEYFYAVNFKELLFDSFAGMTASSIWDGQKNLSGGYLDVSPDGTVLFYRAMSDSVFTNYLFTHTYMDFPDKGLNCELAALNARAALENRQPTEDEIKEASTTPSNNPKLKKGDWGYIYKKDGDYLIAINFQVRFK